MVEFLIFGESTGGSEIPCLYESPGFSLELSLLNKHGSALNVDDLLPPSQNQKPTKWPQTRTRINKQNLETSAKRMEEIMNSPRTDVYKNVNNRGIRSTVYHDPETDTIIAVHTEGKFDGQIKKAQLIRPSQLERLITKNSID